MNPKKPSRRVVFAGGETAGPLMPLLAIAEYWTEQDPSVDPLFIDVRNSVAGRVVEPSGFKFKAIFAGKLRRYWSIWTLLAPALIFLGFTQSLLLFLFNRPAIVIGAGGYVQAPVMMAAWTLRIPILIHQQDVQVTLSNSLCSILASKITTTFEKSVKDFSQGTGFTSDYTKHQKVIWTGNPVRSALLNKISREEGVAYFELDDKWPTVLIIGGGSGAAGLNDAVAKIAPELLEVVQILHSTGVGKEIKMSHERYHQFPFIAEMDMAYAAADIVIARAGIGTITELSQLRKISILVPMPKSHQEANAEMLYHNKAALIIGQEELSAERLISLIRKILFDSKVQKQLRANIAKVMPHDATQNILDVVLKIL